MVAYGEFYYFRDPGLEGIAKVGLIGRFTMPDVFAHVKKVNCRK